jgi:hypothetical protein
MRCKAYLVRALPPPDKLAESNITLSGVTSVLMVYIFAFSFGVSLGPISWNVCSEVVVLLSCSSSMSAHEKPDLPVAYQRKMLCHNNLHAMAFPGP